MIVTTTPHIEGKRIIRYSGVVAGEAILGANVLKDFFAGIRDIVGGRSGTYERELQKAREIALKELEQRAAEAGGQCRGGCGLGLRSAGAGQWHVDGVCQRDRRGGRVNDGTQSCFVQMHIFSQLRNWV